MGEGHDVRRISRNQAPRQTGSILPKGRAVVSPRQRTLLAVATCCISWSVLTTAHAAPYTSLIIFGDSLSDVGNIASSSFDIYPGKYYYEDRFSNGPVWVESLAVSLGLPATKRSTASGDDFAYGGAQTTGTGGLEGAFIRDVDEQVTQYLNQRTIDPTALYVVFAGSNDFINGQTNVATPANRLATDLSRLITAGARNFLVPNLPLLGATPRFNGNATTAYKRNRCTKRASTRDQPWMFSASAGRGNML